MSFNNAMEPIAMLRLFFSLGHRARPMMDIEGVRDTIARALAEGIGGGLVGLD